MMWCYIYQDKSGVWHAPQEYYDDALSLEKEINYLASRSLIKDWRMCSFKNTEEFGYVLELKALLNSGYDWRAASGIAYSKFINEKKSSHQI